jgi:hypothetical protein
MDAIVSIGASGFPYRGEGAFALSRLRLMDEAGTAVEDMADEQSGERRGKRTDEE